MEVPLLVSLVGVPPPLIFKDSYFRGSAKFYTLGRDNSLKYFPTKGEVLAGEHLDAIMLDKRMRGGPDSSFRNFFP